MFRPAREDEAATIRSTGGVPRTDASTSSESSGTSGTPSR